jgi:hypothetical protein
MQGISIGCHIVNHLLYAEDTVLISNTGKSTRIGEHYQHTKHSERIRR